MPAKHFEKTGAVVLGVLHGVPRSIAIAPRIPTHLGAWTWPQKGGERCRPAALQKEWAGGGGWNPMQLSCMV